MHVDSSKWRDACVGMQAARGRHREAGRRIQLEGCMWRVASGGMLVEGCKWRDASGGMHVEGCK